MCDLKPPTLSDMHDNLVAVWGTRSPHMPPARARGQAEHRTIALQNNELKQREKLEEATPICGGITSISMDVYGLMRLFGLLFWSSEIIKIVLGPQPWPENCAMRHELIQNVHKSPHTESTNCSIPLFYFSRKGSSTPKTGVMFTPGLPPWGVRERPIFPLFHHATAGLVMAGVLCHLAAWSQ